MTRAGGADARGYAGLVKELDDAAPKRGETLRKWIRGETDRAAPLLPLELLGEATRGRPLDVLVGGPFTAFDALMNLDEEWAASVRSVHAMAGAWDCSTARCGALFLGARRAADERCPFGKPASARVEEGPPQNMPSTRVERAVLKARRFSTQANLFKNQFNCGADLKAAARVLGPASKL